METLSYQNVSEETQDDSIQNTVLVMTKEKNFEEVMIQNFSQ
jgi:hypothetical protein